jgi:KaiC/GvpD/RAD55 family RecA-like ATPase
LISTQGISVIPITFFGLNYPVSEKHISSGIPRCDTMLGGKGFFRGSSILVSGTAGSGKTSIAASFIQAACQQGKKGLYFAFEESAAQIIRNLRSIGIHLQPFVEQGLLQIHTVRPSEFGIEMHLLSMQQLITEHHPSVLVDPITNLLNASSPAEVKSMIIRLIDFCKMNCISAMFTSLTSGDAFEASTDVNVSSLMDTWLLVRYLESNGECNRGIYVLKSRGMNHSNQICEFRPMVAEASLEESTIFKIAAQSAACLIGDACVIRALSEDRQTLFIASHYHPDGEIDQIIENILPATGSPINATFSRRVIRSGEAMLLRRKNPGRLSKSLQAEFPGLTDKLKLYGLLMVPVRTHDIIFGTLELLSLSKSKPYDFEDQGLARAIADHMAIAMNTARLYNDLQHLLHTEQAMRQQLIQAEKLSSLNRMMATVVHEIKNPVQTIKNCLYLAEGDIQPGSALANYLGMASSEINRISMLVANLREVYRQLKKLEPEYLELSRLRYRPG